MADSSGTTRSTASVDERIVEAKFDTSDFEKGVDKTIKKLDELKESLNLKDAGKSIGQVADETKKATEKASDSLNQLEKRLTTFAGILKQQFLTGIADQIVGVFFKMEHAITGFAKSMTVGMADAGRAAYEQMLTSVRMITNAFKRDGDGKIIGHYEMDEAYDALEKLQSYAEETSYSMDQMTDAMSKMVAAGVPLEDAAKNVQGIANACANAGVNATDASRAFFNLSQAYSSGSLKYTDYRSLELLNMTNEAFKQSMLDAGVAAGTLKKIKDGQYQTIKAAGSKITAGKKVNMQNLSESLKYGWMNTKGMDELFGTKFYADINEITDMLYKQGMNMKEVLPIIAQKYGETAANAFKAAREARSFTDVLNTMKGIASEGWSSIWENMFGKLEEATAFFTDLADGGIADALRDLFTWTNNLLDAWANGGAQKGGRDAFKETLLTIDELVGQVNSAFMKLLPDSEDAGYALKRFTQETRDNVKQFQTWLTEAGDDGESRLGKLVNVARIFSQAFGVVFYALGQAFKVAEPILSGAFVILDKLIEPLSQLGKNSKPFDDITASITNLSTVLQPLTNFLGEVLSIAGDVAAFFFSGAIDTAIMNITFFSDAFGLLLEVITGNSEQKNQDGLGVIGHITNDINTLKDTCIQAIDAVKKFFSALFADLRKILGISQETTEENEEGGFFRNVINFFDTNQFLKDAEAWVQQAKTDVENWIAKVPENVTNFATRIQQAVFGLFYTKKTKTVNTTDGTEKIEFLEETDFKKSLDEWWETTKTTITNFIASIPGRIQAFANQIYEAIYGIFYEKQTISVTTASGTKNYELVHETELKKNLDLWFEGVKTSIKQFVASIPGKIQEFFNNIPNLWKTVSDFLFGKEVDVNATKTKNAEAGLQVDKKETVKESMESGLSQWLASVRENILNFIKSIPSRLSDLGKQIYATVYGIFYQEQDADKSGFGVKEDKMVATPFKKWIDGIGKSIEKWLKKLPKITLKDLWNRIFINEKKDDKGNVVQEKTGFAVFLEGIFGEEQIRKAKENIDSFVDKISGFIENVKTTINDVWNRISKGITTGDFAATIKGVFDDIVNFIASLFTGTTDVEANADWFSTTVANAITWIKTKAEEVWPKVRDFIADIPNKIAGIFKGESSKGKSESAIGQALESFGKTVGGFIADLPSTLVAFFTSAIDGIDALWQQIYDALSGESQETSESSFFWNRDPDVIGNETKTVSKWETFIKNLGTGISNAFAKFPTWISQGLELALKGVNWVLQKLTSVITPEAIAEEVAGGTKGTNVAEVVADAVAADTDPKKTKESSALAISLGKIGQSLIDLITKTIPAFIVAGFEAVKAKAGEWFAPLRQAFQDFADGIPQDATLLEKIGYVGSKIKEKISELIPPELKSAFGESGIGKQAADWWAGVKNIFTNLSGEINQEGSTFFGSLGAVGRAIKDIITLSIPRFIKDGFNSIKTNVGNWWSSLDGIFDKWLDENNNESSPLKRKIAEIGTAIKKAISDLWKLINDFFSGKETKNLIDEGKGPLNPLIDSYAKMFEQAGNTPTPNDLLSKATENFLNPSPKKLIPDADTKKTSLFEQIVSFIDTLMTKVGKYAKDAFGIILPFIIDGWNETIDTIGKFISTIGNLISGDKSVEDIMVEVFGEDTGKNVASHLNTFIGTITGFFQETIPNAFMDIKTAIDERGGIGGIFSSIFGDDLFGNLFPEDEAEKAEKNLDKTVDQFDGVREKVWSILDDYDMGNVTRTSFGIPLPYESRELYSTKTGLVPTDKELSKLISEIEKSGKSIEEIAKAMDDPRLNYLAEMKEKGIGSEEQGGLLGFIDKILGFAGNNVGTIGKIALVVIAAKLLVEAITTLKDVLSVTDEMYSVASAVKWTAIAMAVGGIIALIAKMTELSEREDQTALNNVLGTFDRIVAMLEKLGTVLAIIKGIQAGGSFFDMLGNAFDWRAARNSLKETREGLKLAEDATGELTKAGSGFSFFKNLAASVATKGAEILTLVFGGEAIGNSIESFGDSLSAAFGSIGMGLENALSFISPAIQGFADLNDRLDAAIASAGKLKDFIDALDKTILPADFTEGLIKDIQGNGNQENLNFDNNANVVLNRINKHIDFFLTLSVLMKNLGDAISTLSAVEDPLAQITKFKEAIFSDDFEYIFSRIIDLAESYITPVNADFTQTFDYEYLSYGLSAIAQGMSIFSSSMADLDKNDMEAVKSIVTMFTELLTFLGTTTVQGSVLSQMITGDNTIAAFGRQIQSFGVHIRSFFDKVSDLKGTGANDFDLTKQRLDLVVSVAKGMAEASEHLFTDGVNNMKQFGEELPTFGTHLGSFIEAYNKIMPEDIDLERAAAISSTISSIAELAGGMASLGMTMLNPEQIPKIMEEYVKGLAKLLENKDTLLNLGQEIAKPIGEGIQAAFDHPEESGIQLSIKPVLSMDDIKEQLGTDLSIGDVSAEGFVINVPEDLQAKIMSIPDYSEKLGSIDAGVGNVTTSISGLGDRIDALEKAILSMRLYLNGSDLVGGIMPEIRQNINLQNFLEDHGVIV